MKDIFNGIDYVTFIGIVAGILTSIAMLPQVIKTLREKKAEEISLVMIIFLLSGIGCWTYYGFLKKDIPIIVFNGFSFVLNLLLLILRFKYRER